MAGGGVLAGLVGFGLGLMPELLVGGGPPHMTLAIFERKKQILGVFRT